MKTVIYILSGILMGLGLCISGMIDAAKVKGFLAIGTQQWNPALMFVLGSAVVVYFISYFFLQRRQTSFYGGPFAVPVSKALDKKLVIGTVIFGVGWGMAGVCPGPAIVHVAFLDLSFVLFIGAMFAGFELQKRVQILD